MNTADLVPTDVAQSALSPREAWLAKRQKMLTASDAATALGVNPYASAVELWAEKTGLAGQDAGQPGFNADKKSEK